MLSSSSDQEQAAATIGKSRPSAPFVLVHGYGDDAHTWDKLRVRLTDARAQVHSWDLPGHGARTDDSPELFARDTALDELAARIRTLGAPVHLVGHSLGGYFALALAITQPDAVRSLALVSTGPGFRDPSARDRWNAYMDSVTSKQGLPLTLATLGHQPDSMVIDNLRSITCPLMIILGEKDTRYRDGVQYLQRVFPDSELMMLSDCGHHPQLAQPDELARGLLSFALTTEASVQ